jgi:hypothetical protein
VIIRRFRAGLADVDWLIRKARPARQKRSAGNLDDFY